MASSEKTATVSAPNGVVGKSIPITITSRADGSEIRLRCTADFASGQSATERILDSNPSIVLANGSKYTINWTIPAQWLDYMSKQTSVVATLWCETWNSGTSIGHTYKDITITVPESAHPNISAVTLSVNDQKSLDLTNNDPKRQILGVSSLSGTLTAYASSRGTTLSKYQILNGNTVLVEEKLLDEWYEPTIKNLVDYPISIPVAAGMAYSVVVFDSRGRTASKTLTDFTIVPYYQPTIVMDSMKIVLDPDDATKPRLQGTLSGKCFHRRFGKNGTGDANTLTIRYHIQIGENPPAVGGMTGITWDEDGTYERTLDMDISDIGGIDDTYTVWFTTEDKLTTSTAVSRKLNRLPIFDWSSEDFHFNVPVTGPTPRDGAIGKNDLVTRDYVDNHGGSGGVKPDWSKPESDPAGILNKPDLKPVATTGQYSDLTGKPALKAVATSGSYNDLSDKPTALSQFTDDVVSGHYVPTTQAGTNGALQKLAAGTTGTGLYDTDDLIVSEHSSGATTTNFVRRKITTLVDYLKTKLASVFVNKTGDTVTGELVFGAGTDDNGRIRFTTGGGGIEGPVSSQTGKGLLSIKNVSAPQGPYDAMPREYVDGKLAFYVDCTLNSSNVITNPSATNEQINTAFSAGDLIYLRLHNPAGTILREFTNVYIAGNGQVTFTLLYNTTEYKVVVTSADTWTYSWTSLKTTCINAKGDLSADTNTAYGKISCRKYPDGTCDFTIDFRVYACSSTSSNHVLSQAKIAGLIGATNVTFSASQLFCWKPDGSNLGSSTANPTWGYSGLMAWSSSDGYMRVGRYHSLTADPGAWAMAQMNNGLFYGKMTVIGATYT